MPNTDYEFTQAPKDFPGTVFKDGNCYKHHLIWWNETGEIPGEREVIHHINGNKKDNRFENLEIMSLSDHVSHHNEEGRKFVLIECPECGIKFEKERRRTFLVIDDKKADFCSRSCSSIHQRTDPLESEEAKKYVLGEFKKKIK